MINQTLSVCHRVISKKQSSQIFVMVLNKAYVMFLLLMLPCVNTCINEHTQLLQLQ